MAEAIRKFITDEETGAIKLQFLDADTGLDIPLSQLLDYNILAENGLGQLAPVNAGITTPVSDTPDMSGFSKSEEPLIPPSAGSGSERSHYGSTAPRTQANNFGYVNKPGILEATKFSGPIGQVAGALGATGLMGPIGAVGLAGQVANGVINSNNALAVNSARQSMGLKGLSGPQIAKGTVMGVGKGQVADVTANGQTYSVGLEGLTDDGRATLTPDEARRRSFGQAVEATPEQTQANIESFNKEGLKSKGMLGKIADKVLGRETAAPLSTPTPTLSVETANPVTSAAPTSAVERSNLGSMPQGPQPSVQGSVTSQMGINTSGRGLLGSVSVSKVSPTGSANLTNGLENKVGGSISFSSPDVANPLSQETSPVGVSASITGKMGINTTGRGLIGAAPARTSTVPSFAEASAMPSQQTSIPSVDPSKLGSFDNEMNQENKAPGLAGISSSFNKGTYGTLGTMSRNGLSTGISKALDSVEKALGPDVGVNSGYRSPTKNAAVGGARSSQHLQGNAVDINTVGWSDEDKTAALEAAGQAGVKGVGIYDGDRSLHIDTRANFGTWGQAPNKYAGVAIDTQPAWAQDTLTAMRDAGPYNIGPKVGPTPTPRDTALGTPPATTPASIADISTVAPGITTNVGLASLANTDLGKQSVGRLQNAGFAPGYTDDEISTMAVAAAGELGPGTLRGVARQDPAAMAELGSVVSTMSNRMAQEGVAGIKDPAQFNAFSTTPNPKTGVAPADTTRANFGKFGGSLIDGVKGVVSGAVQSPTPDATHYANRDVDYAANKSYNKDMTGVAKVGQHTFGTIRGEFGAKKSAAAKQQEDRARQAVANFSSYSGLDKADQKQDRAVTKTGPAASTGVASKSAATKTDTTSSAPSKSKSDSKSSGNKAGSGKSNGGSTSSNGPSKSGSTSSSGKGVGSSKSGNKSSSSGSKSSGKSSSSSGAKGAAGGRS